jgi:toxin ParE1/3/4
MPKKGRRFEWENPRLSGLRWWPVPGFKNHRVFYRVLEKEIEVVRVLYRTRNIATVLEEE